MADVWRKPYHVVIEVENRQCRILKKVASFGIKHLKVTDIRSSNSGSVKHLIELDPGEVKKISKDFKVVLSRGKAESKPSIWFDSEGCEVCNCILSRDAFLISGKSMEEHTIKYSFIVPTFESYKSILCALENSGHKVKVLKIGSFKPKIGVLTEKQERSVLESCERYPGFGPSQIRGQLRRQGITISTRSVYKIMEANGYEVKQRKQKKGDIERFEASRPLELCQMDILEFFIHKLKVYLIILLDDYSRFILGWSLLDKTSIDSVIEVVEKAIGRYGKMEEVLTDRGFVFYSWHGINRFEKYLETGSIHHTHARPHHPQTLGKVESVNKQIQKELIHRERFMSLSAAFGAITRWVEVYNYERTHQGLGGFLVPGDRFHGREAEVIKDISEKVDPGRENCYSIPRSLINLEINPEGGLRLYIVYFHPSCYCSKGSR